MAWREHDPDVPPIARSSASPPRAALSDIAQELRTAVASLAKVDAGLVQAGALPAELRADMPSDPVYGRPELASDWFIEPLLTVREVTSVLRISTRAVRHLELRSILIAGETRYRQSEIRQLLQRQESPVLSENVAAC